MSNTKTVKYIFVTGGVVSSLGKGIASASIGVLLQSRGLNVTILKCDPYLNVDPGTLSPFQHGEVYVTDDGAETDLDLGHYERFLNKSMSKKNNTTTGQIYYEVISRERRGDYLGKTVQVIPHITDEIRRRITDVAKSDPDLDVVITELGGTVGDIESAAFLEAIRQFMLDAGPKNVLNVHLTLVPYIKAAGELKTKPTQHSVMKLREIGIQPDIILCRTETALPPELKAKIALFCNVPTRAVIDARDLPSIYQVPLGFHDGLLDDIIIDKLDIKCGALNLKQWRKLVERIENPAHHVKIAICGKYVDLHDSYKSIIEAFVHAGVVNDAHVELKWIDSEKLEKDGIGKHLEDISGLLIPGGFGERGIEGKICAVKYARENKIPFFGICLGLQCAVIEFARNVLGFKGANSQEFDEETAYPVIDLMEEQKRVKYMGGTMRLGAISCHLKKGTRTHTIYNTDVIKERHRHRFEVNNIYIKDLEDNGMIMSGKNIELDLVEIIEIKDHPWFIGCQFHPELKSRFLDVHPLFTDFVAAALNYKKRS